LWPEGGMSALHALYRLLDDIVRVRSSEWERVEALAKRVLAQIEDLRQPIRKTFADWTALYDAIFAIHSAKLRPAVTRRFSPVNEGMHGLLQLDNDLQLARLAAEENRRPLDHKKMLDMLIDEVEDKY